MHVVKIERVFKDYLLGDQIVQALSDITLHIESGVFLAISGPSGSGKTTMLNMIGCIDMPTEGRIIINDQDVTDWSSDQLADLRSRTIGFIFQTFNLLPVLTAAENVEYPLLYRTDVTKEERQQARQIFSGYGWLVEVQRQSAQPVKWRSASACCDCAGSGDPAGDCPCRRTDCQPGSDDGNGDFAIDAEYQSAVEDHIHLFHARSACNRHG